MTRNEELQIENYQDSWSKLYLHLAKNITETFGIEGEVALREGIRNFGIDRGDALREKHKETGLKINLYNLFTYGDLPGDPRFRRNKINLNPQERFSETLVCPIANMWIDMNEKKLGRIYCEEFHHAMYGTYAKKAQINLGQTLTQDGDNHCRFSIYLKPANMSEDERKNSFEEFDPEYNHENIKEYNMPNARDGFNMLCIKIYYNLVSTVLSKFGDEAIDPIKKATKDFAADIIKLLEEKSEALAQNMDKKFFEMNCPINMDINKDKTWDLYTNQTQKKLFEECFYPIINQVLLS